MILEYQVNNFKAFAEAGPLPIRPITLIFGPNSAGKSSIFQSILMLKQTIGYPEGGGCLLYKGRFVDLGSFGELIYKHDRNRLLSFKFTIPSSLLPFSQIHEIRFLEGEEELEGTILLISEAFEKCILNYKTLGMKITLRYFDEILYIFRTEVFIGDNPEPLLIYENNKVFNININHSFWRKYWESFDKTNAIYKIFFEYFNKSYTQARIKVGGTDKELKVKLEKFATATKKMKEAMNYYNKLFSETLLTYKFFLLSSYHCQSVEEYPLDIIEESKDISQITILIAKTFIDFLDSIQYMAPMRESPGRYFQYSGYRGRYVGITGKFLQDLLVSNPANLYTVNQQLSRMKTDYKIEISQVSDEKAGIYDLFALRFINKKTGIDAGITDVGFGFSQILPVVLQCGLSEGKTLLIEQPEYHLHPALQAELGDMFIDSALGEQKNTLIIETHSEHLILRILRRIRETAEGRLHKGIRPIKPDQVSVVYIEPHKSGARIIPIHVNEEGEFDRPWPRGFFRERALELL